MHDPRDQLFEAISNATVNAQLIVEQDGIIAGVSQLKACIEELELTGKVYVNDGSAIQTSNILADISGTPKQIALAEERFIGLMAKPSGIATATANIVKNAGPNIQVVSGAWKKLPFSQKEMIREAITIGGAKPRIAEWPFAYIDKNFVRMLGGINGALAAAKPLVNYTKIIQIKGEFNSIQQEAVDAAIYGADIIFVDTGNIEDLIAADTELKQTNLRQGLKLAFAGGVNSETLATLRQTNVDILDIGRPIVDAPLLDMRLDVQSISP